MDKKFFFNIPRTPLTISTGEIELPILYIEVSNVTFLFTADYNAVADKVTSFGFKPGLKWGRKAVIGLAFYDYKNTSIGPYYEVALAIPVLMTSEEEPVSSWINMYSNLKKRKIGFYIMNLPVTTDIALAAGCEIWGYPKFITDISFDYKGNNFHGEVSSPDSQDSIVSVQGELGLGIPSLPMSLLLYSHLDGKLIITEVNVRGAVKAHNKGSIRLQIGKSSHPMAQNLRALDLDNSQPILTMSTRHFQSRLNLGKEIVAPE